MDKDEIRFRCLQLAVMSSTAQAQEQILRMATKYYEFVKDEEDLPVD